MEFEVAKTSPAEASKRGKIIVLALIITFSLFGVKVQLDEIGRTATNILALSTLYFIGTYIGLLWAFRLKVTIKSLFTVIPQSAFFVAAMAAFMELFFFREFLRAYEFIFLIALGIFLFTACYGSFLMTNIFNVNQFKEIPLSQVAKTASYFLTLLTVYFATFSVLALQLNILITVVVLIVFYLLILLSHLQHLKILKGEAIGLLANTLIVMVLGLLVMMTYGSHFELIAMLPTAIAFTAIGITMHKIDRSLNKIIIFEYFTVSVAIFIFNLFFNVIT